MLNEIFLKETLQRFVALTFTLLFGTFWVHIIQLEPRKYENDSFWSTKFCRSYIVLALIAQLSVFEDLTVEIAISEQWSWKIAWFF